MTVVNASPRERIKGAVGAVVIQLLLGYVLITGLAVGMPGADDNVLKVFGVTSKPPPPVEKVIPPKKRSKRPEGAASPPNLKATATELVAPQPKIPPFLPPNMVVALKPGTGAAAFSGASDVRGPGTGSGGFGNGTGSGDGGDGDGGGGEDETPPRWLKGRIKDSDYPTGFGEAGIGGTVGVRYTVATSGRVTGCRVTRSSGNAVLDQTTCRLIEQRFRYRPSRDAAGVPVPSIIVENHTWVVRDDPADDSIR